MKKKVVISMSIVLLAMMVVFMYLYFREPKRISGDELNKLREQYPSMQPGGTMMSVAPQGALEEKVKNSSCYVQLEYIEPVEALAISEGTDKFGDSMGYYYLSGWKVLVKDVIFGDKSLSGKEIIVRMNSRLSAPLMSRNIPLIVAISPREGGDYWFSSYGAYYCIDGVVLSVFEEPEGDRYSGIYIDDFKKVIRRMK